MTAVYIALIVLQIGVIVFFIRRNKIQAKELAEKQAMPAADTYEGLRTLAMSVTPANLKLVIPPQETLVYGIVMDWDMGNAIATLVAYITGAASLCFSTGGVVAGGGKSPVVGEAAVALVTTAQTFLERAIPVTAADLPPKACVRFYFLTNKGTFAAQELTKHFEDASSPWLDLFARGNVVINAIRESE